MSKIIYYYLFFFAGGGVGFGGVGVQALLIAVHIKDGIATCHDEGLFFVYVSTIALTFPYVIPLSV
jgi:hypothetical protein